MHRPIGGVIIRTVWPIFVFLLPAFLAGSLPAQQKDKPAFTSPRLRITTVMDKDVGEIKVAGVSPGGLGDQLGLKAGNVIKSLHVADMDDPPLEVKATADVFRWLDKVGSATRNKEQACTVTLKFQTSKGNEEIKGKVYRLNASDSKDGGTLYYFKKMDAK